MPLKNIRGAFAPLLMLLTISALAQSAKPFQFSGVSLFTQYQRFKAAHPDATCQPLGADKSCRLSNSPIGGVQPSRMNFNFERGVLVNIAIFFHPAPSEDQIQQIVATLSSEYGKPKAESGFGGQLIYRWTAGKTAMSFFVSNSATSGTLLVVNIPSRRD